VQDQPSLTNVSAAEIAAAPQWLWYADVTTEQEELDVGVVRSQVLRSSCNRLGCSPHYVERTCDAAFQKKATWTGILGRAGMLELSFILCIGYA
jgi:hypothetical protein